MTEHEKFYIAIDLKSFYASVECRERSRDALDTNLVVADPTRTEKTICLAVSPSLKKYGIPGRARLFEVVQKVKEVNARRRQQAPGGKLTGCSDSAKVLDAHPELAVSYVVAPPQMAKYMEISTKIYNIYLKYVAPEDIHVYSIDEVFMDVTAYLKTRGQTPEAFAREMIFAVYQETQITATAGIGTNLYLSKIAMDIVAKRMEPDERGARVAQLDELSYRKLLWNHTPITDFWRVGHGYEKRLSQYNLFTMGDVARCSVGRANEFYNEDLLYKIFGINAELLIDHAWGWEPCTIADVKAYKPENNSLGSGQVLQCAYEADKAKLIVREMTDLLVLDLVEKGLVTDQMVLTVGYDISNLEDGRRMKTYRGEIKTDHYGRKVPKHAHGTANIGRFTSSTKLIMNAMMELYDRIIDPHLLVRRVTLSANHVMEESTADKKSKETFEQLSLFQDYEAKEQEQAREEEELLKEKQIQHAVLDIKKKFGKNAILKGMNLEEGAMTKERNNQIGGHKA